MRRKVCLLPLWTALALGMALLPGGNAEQRLAVRAPVIIAHRGGRKWAPENTLAAFSKSLAAHADGIELDIHRCKSGELVVIHDETLQRTTNGAGYIKDKTWNELKNLDAGSWYAPRFNKERLPLLSEVLQLVAGKLVINIEIKNEPVAYPGIDDDLIALLANYKFPKKIIVSSFDHEIVKSFHQKAPLYKIAMLDEKLPAKISDYAGQGAFAWNPDYQLIKADHVLAAHDAGLKVFVWTPNERVDWSKLTKLGVDGIITDDPAGLLGANGR